MGFRGEALASIAAIAQVELRTRLHDSELGTAVNIEGSHITSQQPTACPPGTSLSVKNLFFNVPARRNFLKKDSVELSHIEEVFKRVSLIHPDIAFSFNSNGKLLYDLKQGSLMQRIVGIYGNHYKERFYEVAEDTNIVRIKGFVGKPEFARRNRSEQYLFVNGRFIKHPALGAAVERAYSDMLPDGTHPSYFIGLQVDPSRIDVNIHPTKTEVKFVEEGAMFTILQSAVKKSLGVFTLANQLDFDTPEEFNFSPAPSGYTPRPPQIAFDPTYNPFRATGSQTHLHLEPRPASSPARDDIPCPQNEPSLRTPSVPAPSQTASSDTSEHYESPSCMQYQNRYIVTTLSSGLAIIDQQRAHERVLYDRLLKQSGSQTAKHSQTLLFPVTCQFTPADAELFNELLPDLRDYGFELSPAGQCTFVATATPPDIKEGSLQPLFEQMLLDYKSASMQKFADRRQSLCASLARQTAVRAGTPLGQEQMQQLLSDLCACPMAQTSPSGKRIITVLKPEDLLK